MGDIPSGNFSTGLTDNVFNTNRDLIAGAITDRMVDIMATEGGVSIESTAETDLLVTDAGSGKVNVKAGVAYDKFGQRIYLAADDSASGEYVGTVDLSSGVDLSTNKLVKIEVDNAGAVEIDCQGATPVATTIDEIVAAINAAGFGTVAFRVDSVGNPVSTGAYILVKSSTTGASSEVEFVAPSATDATNEIFGLSEAAYPHTYNGGGGYQIPDDSTDYNVIIEHLSVESVIGNFEGGYPTGSDSAYTQRNDSYKITIQLATVTLVSDTAQQELLLAQASNTGGTLTLIEKRGDNMIRLRGLRDLDTFAPAAPVLVSLTQIPLPATGIDNIPDKARVTATWETVTDPSGIREYIIQLVLTEELGTTIADADPTQLTLQGFDSTASQLSMDLDLPLGNKYDISVAAKDNSLSQNLSPFTLLGNIYVGSSADDDAILMPEINAEAITNAVAIDWADTATPFNSYEYTYALGGTRPSWSGPNVHRTRNSEFVVNAAPGTEIQVRVRIRRTNMTLSNEQSERAVAGGTVVGENSKALTTQDVSVLATDDGKTARFLKRLYMPPEIAIGTKLAVDVTALTLNSSDRGMIRVYRENQEAGAVNITFDTIGQHDISFTTFPEFSQGWIIIDAYDPQESGTSQAAFTADVVLVYVEI